MKSIPQCEEMSQKVYKPSKHSPVVMGEKQATEGVLGKIVMYRAYTDLARVADETAQRTGIDLSVTQDGIQEGEWLYSYSRAGRKGATSLQYNLQCQAEVPGANISIQEAAEKVRASLQNGEFSEEFWAFDGKRRLFVHKDPKLVEPGKYLATEDGKALGGSWDIKKVRILVSQFF